MTTTLKPRSTTVVIYQGDDAEQLSELRMAVAVAERHAEEATQKAEQQRLTGTGRMGDTDVFEAAQNAEADAQAKRDQYDAFVDEAAERAVIAHLQAIGKRRFRDLVAEHPPRTVKNNKGEDVEHDDDTMHGVNVETFAAALLTFVDKDDPERRTWLQPEFSTRAQLLEFLDDDVSDGDFERLWLSAFYLNKAPGSDPKALRYSPTTPSSAATSG